VAFRIFNIGRDDLDWLRASGTMLIPREKSNIPAARKVFMDDLRQILQQRRALKNVPELPWFARDVGE
jgi:hypothetical protein